MQLQFLLIGPQQPRPKHVGSGGGAGNGVGCCYRSWAGCVALLSQTRSIFCRPWESTLFLPLCWLHFGSG